MSNNPWLTYFLKLQEYSKIIPSFTNLQQRILVPRIINPGSGRLDSILDDIQGFKLNMV